MPNWVWAGYLAPLDGLDETLSRFLPITVGTYNGKNYSVGCFDVALAMYARKSALEKNGIRIPTMEQPWTKDEFDAALKAIKASGDYQYPLEMQTGSTGEWWPYALPIAEELRW